jgi:hypothetical protein
VTFGTYFEFLNRKASGHSHRREQPLKNHTQRILDSGSSVCHFSANVLTCQLCGMTSLPLCALNLSASKCVRSSRQSKTPTCGGWRFQLVVAGAGFEPTTFGL